MALGAKDPSFDGMKDVDGSTWLHAANSMIRALNGIEDPRDRVCVPLILGPDCRPAWEAAMRISGSLPERCPGEGMLEQHADDEAK